MPRPKPAPDAKPDEAPKQAAPRARKPGPSMLAVIQDLLSIPNSILAMFPPTQDDALNADEVDMLATALDKYQQTSPKARKLLAGTVERAGIAGVIVVAMLLALPRLERHGILPAGVSMKMREAAAQADEAARREAAAGNPPAVGAPAPLYAEAVG